MCITYILFVLLDIRIYITNIEKFIVYLRNWVEPLTCQTHSN